MKKIIRRFLFLGSLIAVSSLAHAQNCPSPKKIIPKIIWDSQSVTIDSSLTVRQIMENYRDGSGNANPKPIPVPVSFSSYSDNVQQPQQNQQYQPQSQSQYHAPKPELMPVPNGQYNYRWQKTFQATLGLYQGYKAISVEPKVMKTTYGNGKVCYNLEDIIIKITYRPKIFLALEAMQYQCTKARVYEHELKHHDIDVTALNLLPQFMKNTGYRNYEALGSLSPNLSERENQARVVIERGINEIFDFIEAQTKPYHSKMDTDANYEKEMNYCSEDENKRLMTLIRNGENKKGITIRNR